MQTRFKVNAEIDHILDFLRLKMKERGFSQVRVQDHLGWKGSYISQLFNRTKALRVEQLLMILDTIGIEPLEFFSEYYLLFKNPPPSTMDPIAEMAADEALFGSRRRTLEFQTAGFVERFFGSFTEVRTLLRGLIHLLVSKGLIQMEELERSTNEIKQGPLIVPPAWQDNNEGERFPETEGPRY